MSRIGRIAIAVPSGVDISVNGRDVKVKGPKGELSWELPFGIILNIADGQVIVDREKQDRRTRAYHGLTRALLSNMVQGVHEGFSKTLKIEGVGYRAAQKGKDLEISVGYSNPVVYLIPEGIEVEVAEPTLLHVRGTDKQQVGQTAAEIRKIRPPEPYKGKGIRYIDERVRRKSGKAAA